MEIGAIISERYQLQALVGEGGSAKVFRAFDSRLERDVALKLLHPHLLEADRSRFMREVRTLAQLTHPGVVPVLDLGTVTDTSGAECGYFTMPLLTRGPISALGPLEDDPETLTRFLNAAGFVSRALGYIHSKNIIHRDLTPGNILLDDAYTPRLMDFGLVALSDYSRNLTRSGVTLGTPAYMAPEQARGINTGPHSDLYALGAVLYRVACGSPPFVGENDQGILFQHVYDTPQDPREVNPAVPDAVARVLLALLSKDPQDRPESGEVVSHLWALARREVWAIHARGQYRGGRTRSGEHPDGPGRVHHLHEVWSVPLPGEVTWPAAVVGGSDLLAVGTRGGQMVITQASGRPYATHSARDEVTAPATFVGDHLIFGAWDGSVRRVRMGDGLTVWSHQARAEFTGAPTVWGKYVLAASRDGHLHALNIATGELAWACKTTGPIAGSPVVWAGAALVADESGWLHAIDAKTGALWWKVEVGTVHATPAIVTLDHSSALLILPTWEGEIHALRLLRQPGHVRCDNEMMWTYDLEDEVWASPACAQQRVIVASWSGVVRALNLIDGEDVWAKRLQGKLTASPVISNGLVFLASEAGELLALDIRDGTVRWQTQEREGVQATPLLAGGRLYVAFMNGTLRAYRPHPTEQGAI